MFEQDHNQLYSVRVPILDTEKCQQFYSQQISERMLCSGWKANPQSICLGDLANPLICENKLFGIGSICGIDPDICNLNCGHIPDIFGRISSVRKWIFKTTGISPEPNEMASEQIK